MASKKPWFPFYAGDWLTDEAVTVMGLAAQGAYIRLLAYHWREGSLPADEEALRRMVGAAPDEWSEIWQQMRGAFREHAPGRLVNQRMLGMLKSERASAEHRVEHARAAAKVRWNQKVNAPSMPDACPNMLPSESESEEERDTTTNVGVGSNSPVEPTTDRSSDEKVTAPERQLRRHINSPAEIDRLVDYQTEVLNKLDGITTITERADRGTLLLIARHVPPSIVHAALEATQDARLRALDGELKRVSHARYFVDGIKRRCSSASIATPFTGNGSKP